MTILVTRQPGAAGFPALFIDRGLTSRADLTMAEQYAAREHLHLVDAVVALGIVSEVESYAIYARALGIETVDLEQAATGELAIRLVPERIARRHLAVPLWQFRARGRPRAGALPDHRAGQPVR